MANNMCSSAVIHMSDDSQLHIIEFQKALADTVTEPLHNYDAETLRWIKQILATPICEIKQNDLPAAS